MALMMVVVVAILLLQGVEATDVVAIDFRDVTLHISVRDLSAFCM